MLARYIQSASYSTHTDNTSASIPYSYSTFFIFLLFFFFNDTATTEIYTLSLHDALPIFLLLGMALLAPALAQAPADLTNSKIEFAYFPPKRSEEHTSELQSRFDLVCRLLLEKKKMRTYLYVVIHIVIEL